MPPTTTPVTISLPPAPPHRTLRRATVKPTIREIKQLGVIEPIEPTRMKGRKWKEHWEQGTDGKEVRRARGRAETPRDEVRKLRQAPDVMSTPTSTLPPTSHNTPISDLALDGAGVDANPSTTDQEDEDDEPITNDHQEEEEEDTIVSNGSITKFKDKVETKDEQKAGPPEPCAKCTRRALTCSYCLSVRKTLEWYAEAFAKEEEEMEREVWV